MQYTISCIQHVRRLLIWSQKEIGYTIECLRWKTEFSTGEESLENSNCVVITGLVAIRKNYWNWKKGILNVLRRILFFIVDCFVSVLCCEAHIMSSIEVKRECLLFMDQFILFVRNKCYEEYFFCLFQFCLWEKGCQKHNRSARNLWRGSEKQE